MMNGELPTPKGVGFSKLDGPRLQCCLMDIGLPSNVVAFYFNVYADVAD